MSVFQRRGVITLIPKDENDLTVLSSWRLITILNVDYKILARVIAKRVESKLSKLIHSDQTGFVKGRFIGQIVRLLNDLMEYSELKKVPGILLFIEFEKAFDTLEWHFLILVKISRNGYLSYIRKLKVNGGFMTNLFQSIKGCAPRMSSQPSLIYSIRGATGTEDTPKS